jgi:hypothetical protein
MLNNDDDSWINVTYKKPQSKKPIVNAIVIPDEKPEKPMVIPKWEENKEWRYLTKYDYTLTSKEEYKYEKITRGMRSYCICCDWGETATKKLGRLVVSCQRCFCCRGDDAGWCSNKCFAINKQGRVVFIGYNGKLPENDESN